MPLLDTDIAYAAGIIDGEGCIRIQKNGVIRVHVTNTKPELVGMLHEWFGGCIYAGGSRRYNPRAKDSYVWEVSACKAAVVLNAVLPHLRLKRGQAVIALEVQKTKIRNGRTGVESTVIEFRRAAQEAVTGLNKKGVA